MAGYMNAVFFLNFMVNFLLLFGTNRLTGYPSGLLRCTFGALVGGLYGAVCLLPRLSFLGSPLWRMISLALVAFLTFGWNDSLLHRSSIFSLLSLALGGIAAQTGREGQPGTLLCAGILLGLCVLSEDGNRRKREYRLLKLTLGETSITILALMDTGNQLTDPVTGESVVVISQQAAMRLTGLTEKNLSTPLETITHQLMPGLRLIPYRTVGGSGMLLGMRIKQAELDGKKRSLLVAFAPEEFGKGSVYQALTGGAL